MLLGQNFLLLKILSCIKYSQCHAKLTKLSKNRFVMPGTSCGVLNNIKILHEFPKNDEEIKPCTILDLNENHRESLINIDTIATTTTNTPITATTTTTIPATTTTTITATTITTQTTTTTIPTTTTTTTTTTQTITTTIPTATTTTTTKTTTTAASKDCHPDFVGDGTCDEECNNGDYGNTGCGVFKGGGTKLESFCIRKLLNFEFWINVELPK